MIGLITNDDNTTFLPEAENFVKDCEDNFLELNVSKTKEMIIDFRKDSIPPPPVVINDSEVERVSEYKYRCYVE